MTTKLWTPLVQALNAWHLFLVNGQQHRLKQFTYQGEAAFYVAQSQNSESAKVFMPGDAPLPADHAIQNIGNDGGVVKWELKSGQATSTITETYVVPGPEKTDQTSESTSPPAGCWKPGDTITRHHLLTAYRFIYADDPLSLLMLDAFIELEGEQKARLELGNVYGDYQFEWWYWTFTGFGIQIEHNDSDVHPGIAAQYLWRGFNDALRVADFRNKLRDKIEQTYGSIEDGNLLHEAAMSAWRTQVGQHAAETGIAAAELYLSGIGVACEPVDWVLTINDVSEGHYASLGGLLPFVPKGLMAAGAGFFVVKGIRIQNQAGKVLHRFTDPEKFATAQAIARAPDLKTAGNLMEEAELSVSLRKAFRSGGSVKVPGSRGTLKERMIKVGPPPKGREIAHHDFPWAERK